MRFSTVAAASTGFASIASGFVLGKRALSGEATFYGGNVAGGACSFSTYTLPSGILGTALSDSNWDNSGECGACVSVTGPSGNSITAMIVDECPGCGTNHLDLFEDAFTELADASTGVIDVTWDYVTCPITSALELHNKEGVSAYWFSMQVVNANQAVSSMEVSADGGSTWLTTTRQTYNYFEISSGTGTTTVDVKITAADGSVVTVNNVAISAGASTTASSNFGTSGTTTAVANVVSSSSSVVPTSTAEATTSTSATEPETTSAAPASSTSEPAVFYESTSSSSTVTIPTSTPTSSASSVGATDDDSCESD